MNKKLLLISEIEPKNQKNIPVADYDPMPALDKLKTKVSNILFKPEAQTSSVELKQSCLT